MQRLFSTFPCGLPGAGLLLLRVVVAIPLIPAGLVAASSPSPVILELVTAGAAILLMIGLWTPFGGGLIAVGALGLALSHPDDPWTYVEPAHVLTVRRPSR